MNSQPKVTVVMPVFNGEAYLKEAIESILNQTYGEFEFLIINDGSTDQSVTIIQSYHDPRIRLVHNDQNIGITRSLNKGLDLAAGEYLARMDADDVSLPERLAKQTAFMDQHLEVGVCGTYSEIIGTGIVYHLPVAHNEIKNSLPSYNCLIHPTVMMRTQVLKQNNIYYDPAYTYAQDYELWTRLATITQLANIPEVLLHYRIHPGQVSRRFGTEQISMAGFVQSKIQKGD